MPRPTSRQIKKNKKIVERASDNSEGASRNNGRDRSQMIFKENNTGPKILQDENDFKFENECLFV